MMASPNVTWPSAAITTLPLRRTHSTVVERIATRAGITFNYTEPRGSAFCSQTLLLKDAEHTIHPSFVQLQRKLGGEQVRYLRGGAAAVHEIHGFEHQQIEGRLGGQQLRVAGKAGLLLIPPLLVIAGQILKGRGIKRRQRRAMWHTIAMALCFQLDGSLIALSVRISAATLEFGGKRF